MDEQIAQKNGSKKQFMLILYKIKALFLRVKTIVIG